jgi:hypothetical protein
MIQDEARKAAVRARMAQAGESYTDGGRRLADPVSAQAVLDAASRQFGIPDGALSLVLRHMRETSDYPLLAAGAGDKLKIYLDLKDWVALAKARLRRPEVPHDQVACDALRAAVGLRSGDRAAVWDHVPGAEPGQFAASADRPG